MENNILVVACAFKKYTEVAITVSSERVEENLKTVSMNIEKEIMFIKNAIPERYKNTTVMIETYMSTDVGAVSTKLSTKYLLRRSLRKSCKSIINLINKKVAKAISSNIYR